MSLASLSLAFFSATAVLYALASVLFVLHLLSSRHRGEGLGRRVLIVAFLPHAAYLAVEAADRLQPGVSFALALLSLLLAVGFLLVDAGRALGAVGVFAVPLALVFLLGAGVHRDHVGTPLRSVMLPVHIGLNLLGLCCFALAFVLSVTYVLQEQLLRRKRLGGVFQKLPALGTLDGMSIRLVSLGFPLLSLGIVSGTLWSTQLHGGIAITPTQGFALASWCVFAAVLLLYQLGGWRGRRAAFGTIVGFLCTLAVLVGYAYRGF